MLWVKKMKEKNALKQIYGLHKTKISPYTNSEVKKMKKVLRPDPKTQSVIDAYVSPKMKRSDPQGSYTGKPVNKNEVPVQDADDL